MTAALLYTGLPAHAGAGLAGPDYAPRLSRPALLAVALGHAGLLALLVYPRAPVPVAPPKPLMVSLIAAEAPPVQPQPQPQPAAQPVPRMPAAAPVPPPLVRAIERTQPAPQAEATRPASESAPVPVSPAPAAPPAPTAPATPPVVEETPRPAAPPPVTPPQPADYLNNPKPPYPALSRRLGEEGVVRLNILVNPDGSVAQAEIARSSGFPRLDDTAVKTVQSSWKFEPARQGGKPIAAWVIVPIQFTLRN